MTIEIFYSYSHLDDELQEKLMRGLSLLKRQGLVDDWHDRKIGPGGEWKGQIDAHLDSADIILLLVSPDFIASDYCYDVEMTRALERQRAGEAIVIPVILRPFGGGPTPFHHLQALPDGGTPITEWEDRDVPIANVADGLREVIANLPNAAHAGALRFDISRIDRRAPAKLSGRDDELALLSETWANVVEGERNCAHIFTFVALGGEGKTSLVAKWAANLAAGGWQKCDRVFAWSFYDQGADERSADPSDVFLRAALGFFGRRETAESSLSAEEKGKLLAELAGKRRTLLILDGLEPLQYPPTSPQRGQLKDLGVRALLTGLAANSLGLCVVTTRYSIPDLRNYWETRALEKSLSPLALEAGVDLLKTLGVHGPEEEFEQLVKGVQGHALTLQIMGTFLKRAFHGDIRNHMLVDFGQAERDDGGHAFRAIAAYVRWMRGASDKARRELAILRLLSLFDRPVDPNCIDVLLTPPVISGLTEPSAKFQFRAVGLQLLALLHDLSRRSIRKMLRVFGVTPSKECSPRTRLTDMDWNLSLDALATTKLVTRDYSDVRNTIDTHALIREYFANEVRTQSLEAWREAHRRLYNHYLGSAMKSNCHRNANPAADDLQPFYLAIRHGCHAGLFAEAFDVLVTHVYRWSPGKRFFATDDLGLWGETCAALLLFFSPDWQPQPELVQAASHRAPDARLDMLYSSTSMALRTQCRFRDAIRVAENGYNWARENCPQDAIRLSRMLNQTCIATGDLEEAKKWGAIAVADGEQATDTQEKANTIARYGETLHHLGDYYGARTQFESAERLRGGSLEGFANYEYGDLLLTLATVAYQAMEWTEMDRLLGDVDARAQRLIHGDNSKPLRVALGRLLQSRASMLQARRELDAQHASHLRKRALEGLCCRDGVLELIKRSGQRQHRPLGLLTHADVCCDIYECDDVSAMLNDAKSSLKAVETSAAFGRDSMKLHLADCYLGWHRVCTLQGDHGSADEWKNRAKALIDLAAYNRRRQDVGK